VPSSCQSINPHLGYSSLIRIQALKQWQLRWHFETQNKLHAFEPRVNVINFSVYPAEIIQRLELGTYVLRMDTYYEGRLPFGVWLVKSSQQYSCFIMYLFQILQINKQL